MPGLFLCYNIYHSFTLSRYQHKLPRLRDSGFTYIKTYIFSTLVAISFLSSSWLLSILTVLAMVDDFFDLLFFHLWHVSSCPHCSPRK